MKTVVSADLIMLMNGLRAVIGTNLMIRCLNFGAKYNSINMLSLPYGVRTCQLLLSGNGFQSENGKMAVSIFHISNPRF